MSSRLKLDKELGQHFLTNKGIVDKIIQKINFFGHKEVIEVGPGGGALTHELLASGLRVTAIEFDERWFNFLKEKYAKFISEKKFNIFLADATQIDLTELKSSLNKAPCTLCGNLPYNRGQEIVLRFFEQASFVDSFVVMLQKEVVDKFLPKNERKSYGPLSIKMNFLADNLDSFFVSPGSFSPPPKVDSAVLSFKRFAQSELSPIENPSAYKKFSRFLQASFLQRRKKLSNNLKAFQFLEAAAELGFKDKRAEELNPDDFLRLFKLLKS